MGSEPCILAEVSFLSEAEGGRRSPPQSPWGEGRWYMPHAVVEGKDEYLGVRFVDGPQVTAGELGRFVLALMYHPRVDYSGLRPGVSFALCEGGRVVARGQVLEWLRK